MSVRFTSGRLARTASWTRGATIIRARALKENERELEFSDIATRHAEASGDAVFQREIEGNLELRKQWFEPLSEMAPPGFIPEQDIQVCRSSSARKRLA
jgi:hypothetical protein